MTEDKARQLAAAIKNAGGRVTVVVGPGVSTAVGVPHPTGATVSARSLLNALRKRIEKLRGPAIREALESDLEETEAVGPLLSSLGDASRQREFLESLWRGTSPGDAQRAIVALARDGYVTTLVAAGYDELLDEAFEMAGEAYQAVPITTPPPTDSALPVVARIDPLRTLTPDDGDLEKEVTRWIRRRGATDLVCAIGLEDGAVARGIAEAISEETPLWLINEMSGPETLKGREATTLVQGPIGPFLEATREQLEVEATRAVRAPIAGGIGEILERKVDPKPYLLMIPIIKGYKPLISRLPALRLLSVVAVLFLLLLLTFGLNLYGYLAFRSSLGELDDRFAALKSSFEAEPMVRGADTDLELRKLLEKAEELRPPVRWALLSMIERACERGKEKLVGRLTTFDDRSVDQALYLSQLRDWIEYDQRYNSFGIFPDPLLEWVGHPRNENDDPADDAVTRLSRAINTERPGILLGDRDLMLDILFKRLVNEHLEGSDLETAVIPVIVELAGYESGHLEDRVLDALRQNGRFREGDLSRDAVRTWLDEGRMILLLAQVDRARDFSQAIGAIDRFRETFPDNRVLLSLRSERYDPKELPGYDAFTVRPYHTRELLNWLSRESDPSAGGTEMATALRTRPALLDVARDPLLLSLIIRYRRTTGELPGTKMALFDLFVSDYLTEQARRRQRAIEEQERRRQTAREEGTPFREETLRPHKASVSAKKELLGRIARAMLHDRTTELDTDFVVSEVGRMLNPITASDERSVPGQVFDDNPGVEQLIQAAGVLEELLETGLLVRAANNRIRFVDTQFRRYFQAFATKDTMLFRAPLGNTWLWDHMVDVAGLRHARIILSGLIGQMERLEEKGHPVNESHLLLRQTARVGARMPALSANRTGWIMERLVSAIQSPYNRRATDAVRAFQEFGRPRAILRLLRELPKADPGLALRIFQVVETTALPEAAPLLIEALPDYEAPELLNGCLAALASIGTEQVVDTFQTLVDEEDTPHRLRLAAGRQALLKRLPIDPSGLLERIRTQPERYGSLASALGRLDHPGTVPAALAALRVEGTPPWKEAVARVFAQFGTKRALEALRPLIRDEAHGPWAAYACGWLLDPEGLDPIRNAAEENANRPVALLRALLGWELCLASDVTEENLAATILAGPGRTSLRKALAADPVPASIPRLLDLAAPAETSLALFEELLDAPMEASGRAVLIRALGKTQRAEAVPILTRLYEEGTRSVQKQVLESLGQLTTWQSRRFLLNRLDDSSHRWVVLDSLSRIWNRHSVRPFTEALLSGDPESWRAAEQLGRIGSPAGVEALSTYLLDANRPRRGKAALALGRIGDPAGLEALRKYLKGSEPEPAILQPVLEAIGRLSDSPGRDARLLTSYVLRDEESVFQAAYDAWWTVVLRRGGR